ncbi:MAG: hypothetical protein DCC58_10920 [Chloroflexi bacterium]|nr:MAG: hypothetical protein DCC58_10920 [Chloroflexota bacterium]
MALRRSTLIVLACALGVQALLGAGVGVSIAASPRPAEPPGNLWFERTWERTDQPVAEGAVARTWMWGPQAFTGIVGEPYDESPGGTRTVQYFDKSRMEITSDPDIEPDSVWYVTNGLLVRELITGQMQVGDNRFVQRSPAVVNVAGDADDPHGPTYATFAALLDAPPLADGAPVIQRLSRDGVVTVDPDLEAYGVIGLYHVQVEGINHEIASPFWEFMNSSGLVYQYGEYTHDDLFINPFYATGYPITEAYWADVKVAGEQRDVLMQCFERRCLTYTPGNSPGFETEAGNVGQHYYTWRYAQPGGAIVINEVLYWPAAGDAAWIELYNASDGPVDLTGWVVTNADTSRSAVLPDWIMPKGTYLRVVFGEGQNPAAFRDGASWYTGSATRFFTVGGDGVGLFHAEGPVGAPPRGKPAVADANTIVDFVAWTYATSPPGGTAYRAAVDAGIWPAGGAVVARPRLGPARVHIVGEGESIGRDANNRDTNTPEDWGALGGVDAWWTTPGVANRSDGPFDPSDDDLPNGSRNAEWTIMLFLDARDPRLFRDMVAELNRIEEVGSGPEFNIVAQMVWQDGAELAGARWFLEGDASRGRLRSPMDLLAANRDRLDPGDPASLSAFISWARAEYPAKRYALVLGGHGRGWKGLFTVGPRDDFLTMSELEDSLAGLGQPFDTVFLDAPLMASVEVATQLASRAEMLVASQEIVWGAFPWHTFLRDLEDDAGLRAGEFADSLARAQAELYQRWGFAGFTIASIDLATLQTKLLPALNTFATALSADIDDVRKENIRSDNLQLRIKHSVQEAAEDYADTNFKDLGDVADRVRDLPASAALAADALLDLLRADGDVVRFAASGIDHPASHGLSIYWPHDQDIDDPTNKPPGPSGQRVAPPFDDPLFDPATSDTHLYARDAQILIPSLRGVEHPMRVDPRFRFPDRTLWDEFLYRYYKPVADACIVFGSSCVSQLDVPVGTVLELSALGSSDSDGPEGPSNDEPAHTTTGSKHYYWDLDAEVDHPGGTPHYAEHVLYGDCEDEDCDRDEIDEPDDDLDAVGPQAQFTCAVSGEYTIRLIVWDEHHDLPRHLSEDTHHNSGRHWLHFNVDDDTVVVRCYADARKISEPSVVMPGDVFTYTITLPGSPRVSSPAEGYIHDPLPDIIELAGDGDITCGGGSYNECGYNADSRTVFWFGELAGGDLVTLSFTVRLVDSDAYPTDVVNCAETDDGVDNCRVCVRTQIENPVGARPPLQAFPEGQTYAILSPKSFMFQQIS